MIQRSPATSFSCMATHCSRGVAISPGCQKILSTSITGSPVISPKRLARVDLPDAPRPRMTTRFMPSSLRNLPFGATIGEESLEMGFYRQLDLLVTILTTGVVFVGCIFSGAFSVEISLFIAAGVFLCGLFFGRRIVKVLEFF
jgi:hypothetical protein